MNIFTNTIQSNQNLNNFTTFNNPFNNSSTNLQQQLGGFQNLPFQEFLLMNLFLQLISLLQGAGQQNNNSSFDHILQGNNGDNFLNGFEGKDKIIGNGGDDLLRGNDGNDLLNGGAGDDVMLGGDGNDLLQDDIGRNIIFGGKGDDTLRLSGNFEDYTIRPQPKPFDFTQFDLVMTNNITGNEQTVDQIELFQFADKELTTEQLFQELQLAAIVNPNEG